MNAAAARLTGPRVSGKRGARSAELLNVFHIQSPGHFLCRGFFSALRDEHADESAPRLEPTPNVAANPQIRGQSLLKDRACSDCWAQLLSANIQIYTAWRFCEEGFQPRNPLPVPLHNRWYSSTRFLQPFYCHLPTVSFPLTFELREGVNLIDMRSPTESRNVGTIKAKDPIWHEMSSIISAHLTSFGAVVFRGVDKLTCSDGSSTDMKASFSAKDLDLLTEKLGFTKFQEYRGGASVRNKEDVDTNIFQASDEPPSLTMEPHVEMAYMNRFPAVFFMYCEEAAACGGGQNALADNRQISEAMLRSSHSISKPNIFVNKDGSDLEATMAPHSEFVRRLLKEGCRYEFYWPAKGYMAWRDQLQTNCRNEAEAILKWRGLKDFRWEEVQTNEGIDHDLHLWTIMPVVGRHPVTKELFWVNQVAPMHCSYQDNHPTHCLDIPGEDFYIDDDANVANYEKNNLQEAREQADRLHKSSKAEKPRRAMTTCFANGDPFPVEAIHAYRRLVWANSAAFQLQKGDLLILDNFQVMHGRFSFMASSKRKQYVALCEPGKWHEPMSSAFVSCSKQ